MTQTHNMHSQLSETMAGMLYYINFTSKSVAPIRHNIQYESVAAAVAAAAAAAAAAAS